MKNNIPIRNFKNLFLKGIVILFSVAATLPLLFVLFFIFKQGISVINWNFFTELPKPVGESGGGIFNALMGSLMIIGIASLIAIPFGVSVGVYLSEFKKSKFAYWTLLSVDVLQGIPSIVIGIIIYLWLVKTMGGFSALSGSMALAIMMLPSIIKSTEETLKLIPDTLKEASLSLGVPYYRTVLKVIIPAGISGILSGIILGIARIAGETAPLLFTAFGNPFTNVNILKPMASLPLVIFNYAISPYEEWHNLAWGASLILILFILLLNTITKIAERKWRVQF
ncbi:MAG TPA: phosphate ABC transporter permease PstA [Bacteroidia bacterium]